MRWRLALLNVAHWLDSPNHDPLFYYNIFIFAIDISSHQVGLKPEV